MKSPFLFLLRVLGTALLIMLINIALSVLEVFIFARFVPGKPADFYDAHALQSAPWVAGIAGGLLMFVFTRRYISKQASRPLLYALALPTGYILIDVGIICIMQVDLRGNYHIYLLAALAKYAGAIIAYLVKPTISHENISTSRGIF